MPLNRHNLRKYHNVCLRTAPRIRHEWATNHRCHTSNAASRPISGMIPPIALQKLFRWWLWYLRITQPTQIPQRMHTNRPTYTHEWVTNHTCQTSNAVPPPISDRVPPIALQIMFRWRLECLRIATSLANTTAYVHDLPPPTRHDWATNRTCHTSSAVQAPISGLIPPIALQIRFR